GHRVDHAGPRLVGGPADADGASGARQAALEPRLPHVLPRAQHDDERRSGDRARVRPVGSSRLGPHADRRQHLRDRHAREEDVLSGAAFARRARALRLRALLAALGLLSGAGAARARRPPPAAAYVGKPVPPTATTTEGRRSTDPALLGAVEVKPHQPLSMSDVRETMTHLYTFGRFDDVQVEAENAADGGVAITIALEPVHVVWRVDFRGELGLSEGTLRDRMTERFGATPPVAKAADVAAALKELYTERG